LVCFEYSCKSLDSTICALKHDSTTIYFNDDGCDCDVSLVSLAYLQSEEEAAAFECLPDSYVDYNDDGSFYDDYNCGPREEGVELESGSYPKRCDDYADCRLEDGNYNVCACAFDGNSYCVPDLSSSEFDDMWLGCENEDGDKILYGLYYSSIYPVQVNYPSCADTVVFELYRLIELDDRRDSAASALIISVLGALAILC
jgi:hypothetical protein